VSTSVRATIYIPLKQPVGLPADLQLNAERAQRGEGGEITSNSWGDDRGRGRGREEGGRGRALWGPSFSSTSGPDISELISHAGVVCR